MWWRESIATLKGIGPKKALGFNKLNIATIGDLLNYYPRLDSYLDQSKVKTIRELSLDGSKQLFSGEVVRVNDRMGRGKRYSIITVRDDTGFADIYLFGAQRFTAKRFKNGTNVLVTGRVKPGRTAKLVSEALIQVYTPENEATVTGILPVYNLTESITQQNLRNAVHQVLDMAQAEGVPETIPAEILKSNKFLNRLTALSNIHFPESFAKLKEAKRRLVYEELFLLQCGLLLNKERNFDARPGIKHAQDGELVKEVITDLPFKLTEAQSKAWNDISVDMESHLPMHRLLQGDVGSGKTVIAALALAKTVENGFQGCLMAPTGILAQQHFETLTSFFSGSLTRIELLTSNTKTAQRKKMLQDLATGNLDILIGTHALLQEDVEFANLALVITDEQHRFGVNQRAKLVGKSDSAPDVLIMTATPIPRTLALTVYGDVDVTIMKGLPPGRKTIETLCYTGDRRGAVYEGMVRQINEGRQVYVVCAAIEESEAMDVRSVYEVYEELTNSYLKGIPCALLHGKMKAAEKDEIMERFVKNEIKALITTTVIEVGVNVPNATLMIIENADRFGLAQMHQLRGRVGRGDKKSYCVLLTDSQVPDTLARLQVLHDCNDGFILSERDLELRGAGQLFGLRQHGLPDLYIADILRDTDVLVQTRKDATIALADKEMRKEVEISVQNQFDERFAQIFNS